MKKALLIAFLIAIMVGGSALLTTAHFGMAQNGTNATDTNISGIIASNATWTQADSPYTLTGNLLVNATLIIQAGTTVNLGSYYIEVNATLQAWGNYGSPVTFNGGQIEFTQYSTNWNPLTGSGCIIVLSTLSSSITVDNSPLISHDVISGAVSIAGRTAIISNNTITGGISVSESEMPTISNNVILGQGISLFLANATVSNNTISGCSVGIEAYTDFSGPAWINCTSLIEGNLIVNNTNGIEVREQEGSSPNSPIILDNTIANNTIGIYVTWIGIGSPEPEILNNNIYSNSNYNIELDIPGNVNATYNWWGTTHTEAINQTIYDFKDDFTLGVVSFVPILTAPNTEAPTYIAASAGAGGSIAPSGVIRLNYGGSQTFSITPNTGYYISNVLVNGTSVGEVSAYTVQNIQGATIISATFAIDTYSLTVNVGAGGSSNIASQTVNWGSIENFEFTPDTGYSVADVVVNGTINEGAVTSLSITVTGHTTVSVSFAINTYTITVTQSANGQITPGTTTVNYGDNQNFTIVPNHGYYIASITEDSGPLMVTSPSSQTVNFTHVTASHTLTATYALTPAATPTPTPVPTASSSPAAVPSSTPNITPSSTPTVPEFPPLLMILTAFMAISLSTAALLTVRKNKRTKNFDTAREKS